jgi:hypothetical protein
VEQYIHLLIARSDDFVPERSKLIEFCQRLIDNEVVPNAKGFSVSTPADQVRTMTNPFTGETVTFPTYAHQRLKSLSEFEAASAALANYCLHFEGMCRPELPPIPITTDDPYAVTIRCHVTAVPHSTSSIYDDYDSISRYDRPCPEAVSHGHFTDATTGETVEVPDGGRARFWIEFELGKWLFPSVKNGNLEVLHPRIIEWAQTSFGVPFAQGCHYF